jgi:hypothetical protein
MRTWCRFLIKAPGKGFRVGEVIAALGASHCDAALAADGNCDKSIFRRFARA